MEGFPPGVYPPAVQRGSIGLGVEWKRGAIKGYGGWKFGPEKESISIGTHSCCHSRHIVKVVVGAF